VILVGLAGILVFLPIALAYWQLARMEPRARSSFQAVRGSMGEGFGFFVGWLLLSGTLLLAALSAAATGEYLSSALTSIAGVAVSWQTIALASLGLASGALFLGGTRWTRIRAWVWGVVSLGLLVCALFMFLHPQSVRFRRPSGISFESLTAAIPGVAIAAALMPPLCTVGIGLASGWGPVAGGGLLLFVTNLVAISLAGGAVFLLLGFRPRRRERHSRIWFRRGVTISFVLLLVVTGILGGLLVRSLRDARQETAVRQDLTRELSHWEGVRLVELEWETDGQSIAVDARVQSPEGLSKANVESIAAALSKKLGRPVTLRIVVEPVLQVTSP